MRTFETIRPDAPEARALLDRYFADRAATRPAALGAYRATHPQPAQFEPPAGVFVLVRDADGTPVACGGVRRIRPPHPPTAGDEPGLGGADWMELKHLFTQPARRGGGLATELLERLERLAVELGADRLVLDTSSALTAAARLYARRGFTPIAPFNRNPNADTWLGKRLGA